MGRATYTRARVQNFDTQCEGSADEISYPPEISKIRDYSLSSILHRLYILTDREHSPKNRQKVKTVLKVSGVVLFLVFVSVKEN